MIDLTGYRLVINADNIVTACVPPAPAPLPDIPYRSQWDADANQRRNDCGPACAAMVLASRGIAVRIDDLARKYDPQDDGTTGAEIVAMLAEHGVKGRVLRTAERVPPVPSVCLVSYAGFARANVQDTRYRGWHWLVILRVDEDAVTVHDPDWWGARRDEGNRKHYSRGEFDAAWVPYGQARIAVTWE